VVGALAESDVSDAEFLAPDLDGDLLSTVARVVVELIDLVALVVVDVLVDVLRDRDRHPLPSEAYRAPQPPGRVKAAAPTTRSRSALARADGRRASLVV
jgi:hypothetical protein